MCFTHFRNIKASEILLLCSLVYLYFLPFIHNCRQHNAFFHSGNFCSFVDLKNKSTLSFFLSENCIGHMLDLLACFSSFLSISLLCSISFLENIPNFIFKHSFLFVQNLFFIKFFYSDLSRNT